MKNAIYSDNLAASLLRVAVIGPKGCVSASDRVNP